MHIARLEVLVQSIAYEPIEISKEELCERLCSMGINQETVKEIEDALWDLYLILRERNRCC